MPSRKRRTLPPVYDPLGLGDPHDRLSMDDVHLLAMALLTGSGKDDERELPDQEIHDFIGWCYQTLVAAELVRLMLEGLVVVRRSPGSRHGYEFKRVDAPPGSPVN
jgi:hypothetical protein